MKNNLYSALSLLILVGKNIHVRVENWVIITLINICLFEIVSVFPWNHLDEEKGEHG